jgi:hypothetical protein
VSRPGRALFALVVLVGATHGAVAQPASPAEKAFARGREALTVGKYAEACAAFEDSERLDPQTTTQFNIALCDEQLGKLASALAIYQALIEHDDAPARRAKSADMLGQLSVRVARLEIKVVDPRPGIEIMVNGMRALDWKNLPIDLGTSRVVARAPGVAEWRGDVVAKSEGQRVSITIKLEPRDAPRIAVPVDKPAEPPATVVGPDPPPAAVDDTTLSPRKKVGLVLIVGGGVAVAGGVTFGLLARSAWHDAKNVCDGTTCDTPAELATGQALVDRARMRGTIATALVVAGGLVAAGGVIVWVTAPKTERTIALSPTGSASSVGFAVLGSF